MSGRELYHHGVKGQKWGVRNGPPYPIEDKVMRKGTRLNSVNGTARTLLSDPNSKRWKYTYNANNEWDNKVYKGPFSVFLLQYGRTNGLNVYEHQYEVVKDLKMPTKKERLDEYKNLYEKNAKQVAKDLQYEQDRLNSSGLGDLDKYKGAAKVDLKNVKTQKDYEDSFVLLNMAMENAYAWKTTREYSKIMAKKFDAMVDDNNQGIYNQAQDPVIVFRAREALREVAPVKMVALNEIAKNYVEVRDEMAKRGDVMTL